MPENVSKHFLTVVLSEPSVWTVCIEQQALIPSKRCLPRGRRAATLDIQIGLGVQSADVYGPVFTDGEAARVIQVGDQGGAGFRQSGLAGERSERGDRQRQGQPGDHQANDGFMQSEAPFGCAHDDDL